MTLATHCSSAQGGKEIILNERPLTKRSCIGRLQERSNSHDARVESPAVRTAPDPSCMDGRAADELAAMPTSGAWSPTVQG